MPTCAEVLAQTLKDAGVTRMFGLPGGEILDFIDVPSSRPASASGCTS